MNTPIYNINEWFNNKQLRIIGTSERPFFYAIDLGAALGIKDILTTIMGFTDGTEIVTPAMRTQYNLITYRRYKDGWRPNNKVVLLTIQGMYRAIFTTRVKGDVEGFKLYLTSILEAARAKETAVLQVIRPEDHAALQSKVDALQAKVAALERSLGIKNDLLTQAFERIATDKTRLDDYTGKIFDFTNNVEITTMFIKYIRGSPYERMMPNEYDKEMDEKNKHHYDADAMGYIVKITNDPDLEDEQEYTKMAMIYDTTRRSVIRRLMHDSRLRVPIRQGANDYCQYLYGSKHKLQDEFDDLQKWGSRIDWLRSFDALGPQPWGGYT